MQRTLKIATIGGGSSYTPELVEGFIKRHAELPVSELWLVDIEDGREKLEIVGDLARRMAKKAGVPLEIHTTLNRRDALKNADFVTTQLRVGLMQARIKDEKIPLKYDVIGQETNGPGGLFKGLRTIPVVLDIIRDMKELCPEAWLVNFTNPAGMVTEAVMRYADFDKMVGLCNVPLAIQTTLAEAMGYPPASMRIDFAGLNHMVFGLRVHVDGVDRTAEAVEAMATIGFTMENIANIPWEPDFIRGLGIIPCPYHRYYFKTDEMLAHCKEEAAGEGTRGEVVAKLEAGLFELYKNPELDIKPPQLEKRGGAYYSDAACELINAMHNDKGTVQTVNTRNNGAISNLPHDAAVELNCVITRDGPKPLTVGALPDSVSGLVNQIKSFERVAAKAAVTGDYKTALTAMTINPLVPGDHVAKQILDDMLEAHRAYLPQFFKA